MVETRPTGAVEDAMRVELEAESAGVYCHRHRLLRHGLQQAVLAPGGHGFVAGNGGDMVVELVASALFLEAFVRVLGLGSQPMVASDELEGILHEPSTATMVFTVDVTVHQLLLRQRNQFAGLDVGDSLDRCHRGEGPTRPCSQQEHHKHEHRRVLQTSYCIS